MALHCSAPLPPMLRATGLFTPSTALADGSHSLTATATDAAGNVSAASTAFT
ncbi:Ig-like domain-containing protein, partial [Ralstonia solanacearum]|uniref:Ig-like domain-containing protein n=1 Tax=Ralstonia solanacearum TaxID=305 RepID=UPI00399D724E